MSLTRTVLSRVLPASARFATPVSGFTGFRHNSGSPAGSGEAHLIDTLRKRFPGATDIQVVDISGGCGSMFEVFVEAGEFKGLRHRNLKSWKENALMHADFYGLRMIQQHRLVTEALQEEIKAMHGVRISTAVPKS